ncbi:MaoC family dehydratase [Kutzneria albida]|uniref:MaoC-like domain-containing protein n=1 Tax=Kutzneria albida DSM 43870 TaxID=1449976 RepID=W5WN96_9PSEU|nr:MaoC/PaaZ C-terminal domain-containing protein [Kutzneria albida]AHI02037.1 hypothetical protein KALB_8680 [Kutzneria albida DSM 43870]
MAGLLGLYAKAGLTGFLRDGKGSLPTSEYRREAVLVDREHLAQYNKVCGFGLRDELPVTYPHILAFPMQIELMTQRDFPFALPGLVHIANSITVSGPLRLGEPFDLRVHAVDLREHERGKQFDVISEATVDGAVVWRDVSTYLRKGGGSGSPAAGERAEPPRPSAVWQVPSDIGRRYGEVSGDRNPIHLHPLTAKAFGFPTAIAHGMWSKARCVAALEGRLPEAYTVSARFKLPVLLPAKVGFSAQATEQGWQFALHDLRTGKPHLSGEAVSS